MKPKLKFDAGMGMWLCGGLHVAPWHIDWFAGKTITEAYESWKRNQ